MLSRLRLWLASLFNRYEGAAFTVQRSYVPAAIQDARLDLGKCTREELVRKSRYWEKNDALYNRLCDLFESYTVGSGLILQPASADDAWNKSARDWWTTWERFCDLTSRQSFGTLQSLIARAWFVDGECFVVLTRGESGRPRIQVVEAHNVYTPTALQAKEGNSVIDGVKIDSVGRPVGYYINDKLVSADSVIHVFEPNRPGQYRGIPFCHAVLNDIHDLSDLQLLEMQRARQAAEVSNIITTSSGELDAAQARRNRIAVGATEAGNVSTRDEYYRSVFGATARVLRRGDDFKQFKIESPSEATRALWLNLEEKICAGIGMPRILAYPGSMQGTVYRGALDMANSFFRVRSSVLAECFRRIYEFAMGWAANNEPTLKPTKPLDWYQVNIQPPRAVNVDVGRNSSAQLAELEAGATTLDDIYSPLGKDWREQLRKRKAELDYIRELGLEAVETPQPMEEAV
jgi:lambda family phage portal protein